MTETIVEIDQGTCTKYPDEYHTSYASCVVDRLRAKILPVLGCMVPWMSEEDACSTDIQILPKHRELLAWLLMRISDSLRGKGTFFFNFFNNQLIKGGLSVQSKSSGMWITLTREELTNHKNFDICPLISMLRIWSFFLSIHTYINVYLLIYLSFSVIFFLEMDYSQCTQCT